MYSVLRRLGPDISVAQARIATLEDARKVAIRMRKSDTNKSVRYYIQAPPRQASETEAINHKSSSSPIHATTGKSRTAQRPRHSKINYRVVRIQGRNSFAVKGGFQSLDEACEYALDLQKQTPDSTVTYQVEYTSSNKVNTPITSHHNEPESARASQRSPLNTGQFEGSKFSVIRERYGVQEIVRGGFQTQSEAHAYGLSLLGKTSDRTVQFFVEYIGSNQDVISIPIRDRHQEEKSEPRQKKTKARRKKQSQQRLRDGDTENRNRDSYFPLYYHYSGELLGLGIPAQTGHGRRSRTWFNDPT